MKRVSNQATVVWSKANLGKWSTTLQLCLGGLVIPDFNEMNGKEIVPSHPKTAELFKWYKCMSTIHPGTGAFLHFWPLDTFGSSGPVIMIIMPTWRRDKVSQAALDQKRQGQRGWTAAPPSRAFHFLSPVPHRVQRHELRSISHQKRAADPKTVAVESPVGSKCWKIASTPAGSAWCARQELQKLGVSEVGAQQESTMDHFVAFVGKRNSLGIGMPPLFLGTSLRYINSLGPHWRFRTYHPRIALICIDLPLLGVDVNDMEC